MNIKPFKTFKNNKYIKIFKYLYDLDYLLIELIVKW